MDSIGVWAMALYPNVGGFGNEAFLKLGDPELMLACVQAYNDFQIDWISADPRRFIPILATPFWDPGRRAREIERSAARGHRGVLFTGEPQKFGFPALADPHWDPLWAAAQDTGLPVSFHIGSGSLTEEFTPEKMKTYGMGALNAKTTVGLFLENGKQLVDLCSRACSRASRSSRWYRSRAGSASCHSSSRRPTTASSTRRCAASGRSSS
jgi:hypothetical protein